MISSTERGLEERVSEVVTSKGSIYTYLEDGKTQRYKAVENKKYPSQDILVFVPDFDWVRENAPFDVDRVLGENPVQYEQTLLSYTLGEDKKCMIVDEQGKKLGSNKEVIESKKVFLTFGDEEKIDFAIPVSKLPQVGFYAFDTRKFESEGEFFRDTHLGNKVISFS